MASSASTSDRLEEASSFPCAIEAEGSMIIVGSLTTPKTFFRIASFKVLGLLHHGGALSTTLRAHSSEHVVTGKVVMLERNSNSPLSNR